MQEELQALEAQRRSLQLLVSELLLANQKLRLEVADLKRMSEPSARATHPQPRQDR
jgi:regulator of replication initiation timing